MLYKELRRGFFLSLTLNHVSDIQILHRQSKIVFFEKSSMDAFQTECLIILVVVFFGTKVVVTVVWHVLFEKTSQVFLAFSLAFFEAVAHDDDRPVMEITHAIAVLPETDVAVKSCLWMPTHPASYL